MNRSFDSIVLDSEILLHFRSNSHLSGLNIKWMFSWFALFDINYHLLRIINVLSWLLRMEVHCFECVKRIYWWNNLSWYLRQNRELFFLEFLFSVIKFKCHKIRIFEILFKASRFLFEAILKLGNSY